MNGTSRVKFISPQKKIRPVSSFRLSTNARIFYTCSCISSFTVSLASASNESSTQFCAISSARHDNERCETSVQLAVYVTPGRFLFGRGIEKYAPTAARRPSWRCETAIEAEELGAALWRPIWYQLTRSSKEVYREAYMAKFIPDPRRSSIWTSCRSLPRSPPLRLARNAVLLVKTFISYRSLRLISFLTTSLFRLALVTLDNSIGFSNERDE